MDKPLAKLTKRTRDKLQIFKIRDERGILQTHTNKIQGIVREF
jgi:hypothetical protein